MIILDFDGVLFNDERFKRDYWRLFRRAGIPYRVHQAAYAETKERHAGGYRHDLHLALIQKHISTLRIPRIESDTRKLLARSSEYIYRDARPFLDYWKLKGEALSLVSSGRAFQKEKVRASGLSSFFRVAAVVNTIDKVEPIRAIMDQFGSTRIAFIDDRRHFADAVKRNFPKILVLQLARRKEQTRSILADAVVPTLAAARRLIERRQPMRAPS